MHRRSGLLGLRANKTNRERPRKKHERRLRITADTTGRTIRVSVPSLRRSIYELLASGDTASSLGEETRCNWLPRY